MRNCEQKLCDLRGTGKCPICKGCKAPPDLVSDFCEQCYCCEKEQGFVRGGQPTKEIEQKVGVIIIQPTTGE
jgi:hypothetical protein